MKDSAGRSVGSVVGFHRFSVRQKKESELVELAEAAAFSLLTCAFDPRVTTEGREGGYRYRKKSPQVTPLSKDTEVERVDTGGRTKHLF